MGKYYDTLQGEAKQLVDNLALFKTTCERAKYSNHGTVLRVGDTHPIDQETLARQLAKVPDIFRQKLEKFAAEAPQAGVSNDQLPTWWNADRKAMYSKFKTALLLVEAAEHMSKISGIVATGAVPPADRGAENISGTKRSA